MTDNLFTGTEARDRLIAGIRKVRDAVAATLGTGGSNGIIEAIERPGHLVTNDGITIAQSIHLADPIENMGKNILLEAISRANKESGDGSTTTTVLTAAIIEEGMKHLDTASPMDLKRQLEACLPAIEESIRGQRREITVDEVGKVATISAEDETIGAKIQEIYQQIGKDGIVHWDISKTGQDYYTIGTGITVNDAGYASPYMCDADASGNPTNKVRIKNPKILILRQKVSSAADFEKIAVALNNQQVKDLVVFCEDIDPLVIPSLVMTRMQQGFRFVVVKMPTLWKDWWYEDLAKATGATIIDPSVGLSLLKTTPDHLGTVSDIVITKDETVLDGIKDVTEHITALQEDGSDDALLRISRLNTKTARYFVGAMSESALSYRRLKVEDAISAAYQALQGGIVLGGGIALAQQAETVSNPILQVALRAPYEQIQKNMGSSFNGEDMLEQEVYDPAPVVLNSVKNAVSVAAAVLTANTVVILPRDTK